MKLDLYLKDVELSIEILPGYPSFVTGDSSLLNYHKLPEMFEQLSLYWIKLYTGITISRLSAPLTCSSFMWVMHFLNRAQVLNTTLLWASPPAAVMSPVSRIYGYE